MKKITLLIVSAYFTGGGALVLNEQYIIRGRAAKAAGIALESQVIGQTVQLYVEDETATFEGTGLIDTQAIVGGKRATLDDLDLANAWQDLQKKRMETREVSQRINGNRPARRRPVAETTTEEAGAIVAEEEDTTLSPEEIAEAEATAKAALAKAKKAKAKAAAPATV